MKTLWLLRHAKSSWDNASLADFDRPLNARGSRNARAMAERLAALSPALDRIVSSPARRARDTVMVFAERLGLPGDRIDWTDSLYEASPETWLRIIRRLDPAWDSVLMAGHNPTITQLVRQLGRPDIDNVPTCGLAECRAGSWNDFPRATVRSFDHPKRIRK